MQIAERIGNFQESVIRKMTRLAIQYEAINLSQGFPDFDTPLALKKAATRAIMDGHNQYSPTWGQAPLREKLAELYTPRLGWEVDAARHVTVACGVTETMNAAMLAILKSQVRRSAPVFHSGHLSTNVRAIRSDVHWPSAAGRQTASCRKP